MPGKKAKAPVTAPASAKKGAAKASAKGGAIGSLKKILGFASPAKASHAKSAPAAKPVAAPKGAKPASTKAMPAKAPVEKNKAAKPAPAAAKAGKGGAPAKKPEAATKPELHVKGKSEALTKAKAPAKAPKAPRMRAEGHGAPVCREVACELMCTTGGYCRMHYIKNWKKIKRKEMILKEKKLNHYIEELVSKYPDKYIEAIRQDLASEKDFAKVIADLEIEEGMDDFESVDTESAEGMIDNLKRDFEDDGDVF